MFVIYFDVRPAKDKISTKLKNEQVVSIAVLHARKRYISWVSLRNFSTNKDSGVDAWKYSLHARFNSLDLPLLLWKRRDLEVTELPLLEDGLHARYL